MVLTRRAHRARMLITLWLPNEVLTEIIRCTPQSDQATLCRVSKLFHALVLPILNREVVFIFQDNDCSCHQLLENFSRAFLENPERADAAQFTSICRSRDSDAKINIDLLLQAMKLMNNLEHLSFHDWHQPTIAARLAMARLMFPRLSFCRMMGDFSASDAAHLVAFFAQHPSITRVCMLSRGLGHSDDSESFEPQQSILPHLKQYEGRQLLFHKLATRELRAVRFGPCNQLTTSDVQTLKARIDHAFPLILSLRLLDGGLETAREHILSPLSAGIPNIRSLQLQTPPIDSSCMGPLKDMAMQLAQFRHIAYFAVTDRRHQFLDVASAEAVFQTWTAASPTLQGCCIGEVALMKVDEKKWEQWSVDEFEEQAGFSVFDEI
ncbi:hypothetical protein FB45DRAFT_1020425 [Roridomyces roridus]|uniref:F-box domain-containing protein n=1 Tax=Roridomyces roridus TaxID=1738132 RepID=A0AAD7FWN6_9AGAR|nr:hypothetical protein FB45DRAFT_1020425 [Roridomyces roridus]